MTRYPPPGFSFWVSFDISNEPIDIAFQDVAGIGMELQTEDVVEGGENRFTQKLPARANYTPLVLKRGLAVQSTLTNWVRDAVENLSISPTTIIVALLNDKKEPLMAYRFLNAYPLKWSISNFNAESSSLVIESLELYYQYFKIINS
ncbi:MAG: phage tail protein [Chitinophagaceae bacterium]|nr:phage tail protein [Chitinophagaceae bacterium]